MEQDFLARRASDGARQIAERLKPCPDLRVKAWTSRRDRGVAVWLEGLVDPDRLQEALVSLRERGCEGQASENPGVPSEEVRTITAAVRAVLDGYAVIARDGASGARAWRLSAAPARSVERSENEPTLHGPQEAFIESLAVNLAMVRKRLKSPRLKIETFTVGETAPCDIAVLYEAGVAKPHLVREVRRRISQIRVDYVADSNEVREFINDPRFSVFPTTEETERPDRVVAGLMEGRVAIIADGSPTCLMVPVTFAMNLSSPEDYYMHYSLALPLRLLRHLMFWSAVLLPALYVALVTYNQDLLPTPLLVSVAAQHAGIPFPTIIEALGMMTAFEALREAGTRLPRAVGQSVSIVGTLVIGDAAVRAGLVSPGMVIIVSATGVASFTLPALGLVQAARLLQFPFVLAAGLFGLYGVLMLGMALLGRMASLRSFGVPYFAPIAPTFIRDMKDVIVRAPWWMMQGRPRQFESVERERVPQDAAPAPKKTTWWRWRP
ncbi:spore germination protein [Alicyclobacillus sendaiensis]|uniref:Spore germination protein n=1 Tax=Alicyclobacillus sendaiensis PA2 TaxID=3029425 RepID=A0ABT6XVQ2_ALISE|nr:spore germination protein [Alicyclobacillus sendaiensis]MDI9259164.1 spore germination protein [Alicyclobacillus sendaiensis PA2]